MKSKAAGKNVKSKSERPAHTPKQFRFAWTLLVYPVLVIAALAILYGVNRSIQHQSLPGSQADHPSGTAEATRPDQPQGNASTESATPIGTPAGSQAETVTASQSPMQPDIDPTDIAGDPELHSAIPDDIDPETLQGAARTLALLHLALKAGDNALIKQYMDELVLLGDDAIGALSEIILNGNDETSIWAAKALARIGTPLASATLLETLALTPDGDYRELLIKEASAITNHDSWPVLLDAIQGSMDSGVMRAAGTSLANLADAAVIDEIAARYAAAATEEEANRLAQTLQNIRSSEATEALLALAGDVSSPPQDSLERAAIEALSNIGNTQCVDYLLNRLEASPPGQGSDLFNSIAGLNQPQAEAALRYAAAGSKGVSAEHGRTAAICALENFPNEQTYALLQRLAATEENLAVVSAASRTLERMTNANPMFATNTTAKGYEAPPPSSNPLQK